jgi:four helix bundle protein
MLQIPNPKPDYYDLEERTFKFAQRVIGYVEKLPKTSANVEVTKQLIRAAGSIVEKSK